MDARARQRTGPLHPRNSQQGFAQDRCMVTCKLQRNTFLPGEQIRGTVKFGVSSEDQETVDILEATVQAHGYVKVDPRWITLPAPLRTLFQQEATADEKAIDQEVPVPRYSGLADDRSACVFASEVAVLLKDENVDSGNPASFRFSLALPEKLTPTFRGIGVRYAYAITVRVRRTLPPPPAAGRLLGLVRRRPASPVSPGFSTTDIHVAFTVLSEGSRGMINGTDLEGEAEVARYLDDFRDGDGIDVDAGGILRENWGSRGTGWGRVAFAELEMERQSSDEFEFEDEKAKAGGLVSGTRAVTWNMQGCELDDGCGRSAPILGAGDIGHAEPPLPPLVYSIRSGDHRIGSFVLHKAEFRAGDIVLGNFDFSGASTRCLQVCACLEVCEENKNAFSGFVTSPALEQAKASTGGKSTCHKRVVDSCKELTPCLVQSSVTLSLPMDAPVTFSTELVNVSWSLRFEFVMSPPEARWGLGGVSPSKSSVLKWAVPIRVVPPRRSALPEGGGYAGGDLELGFNAMDATGKTVIC